MAKLLTNRTDNDIKNKWYSMKRKEERTGLHKPSLFSTNLSNRVSTTDDQEVTDVPEDIAHVRMTFIFLVTKFYNFSSRTYGCNCLSLFSAQRAATLSRVGVVGNPEPTAPTVAVLAPAPATSAEAESDSAVFVDRNWSMEIESNQAGV